MAACISGIAHQRLLHLAELRPVLDAGEQAMVLVASPPIMVARTVTFSAPCFLRSRLLELLLHVVPGDALDGMNRY